MFENYPDPSTEEVDLFRLFINDLVEVNRLLKMEELTDDRLKLCMKMALDEYNNTTPLIDKVWTYKDFPSGAKLFHGAAVNAFKMAGLMHLRNMLSYTDGGISVNINEKEAQYRQWYNDFRSEWQSWVKEYKTAKNYENAFGHVPSEYSFNQYR